MKNIEQYLTSVFGNNLKSTFNMRRKDNPGYATAAVDMLFVSPNIRIVNSECSDVDISDHLPVIATLEVK
jgi:endonuclease/exonuclease/phosphatase family metal-dependent hydrolase